MKPTLFLFAAGMGSRYGGLKQLDGLGPHGETIMDYSIYDAIKAGFGKLVFVIRKDFEQDFRDKIISKYEGHIPCELVFQSIDKLPEGFTCPEGRQKPWGTNHAVMMGEDVINEPFILSFACEQIPFDAELTVVFFTCQFASGEDILLNTLFHLFLELHLVLSLGSRVIHEVGTVVHQELRILCCETLMTGETNQEAHTVLVTDVYGIHGGIAILDNIDKLETRIDFAAVRGDIQKNGLSILGVDTLIFLVVLHNVFHDVSHGKLFDIHIQEQLALF